MSESSTLDYSDIINLSRPIIKNHKPMRRDLRAAQFAPYAALTGHKELIHHTETENVYREAEIIPNLDALDDIEDDYNQDIDFTAETEAK